MDKKMNFTITKEQRDYIKEVMNTSKEEFKKLNYKENNIETIFATINFYDDEIFIAITLTVNEEGDGCYIKAILGSDTSNESEDKVLERLVSGKARIEILKTIKLEDLDSEINFEYKDDNYIVTLK